METSANERKLGWLLVLVDDHGGHGGDAALDAAFMWMEPWTRGDGSIGLTSEHRPDADVRRALLAVQPLGGIVDGRELAPGAYAMRRHFGDTGELVLVSSHAEAVLEFVLALLSFEPVIEMHDNVEDYSLVPEMTARTGDLYQIPVGLYVFEEVDKLVESLQASEEPEGVRHPGWTDEAAEEWTSAVCDWAKRNLPAASSPEALEAARKYGALDD